MQNYLVQKKKKLKILVNYSCDKNSNNKLGQQVLTSLGCFFQWWIDFNNQNVSIDIGSAQISPALKSNILPPIRLLHIISSHEVLDFILEWACNGDWFQLNVNLTVGRLPKMSVRSAAYE
jgi:hypothetical protein